MKAAMLAAMVMVLGGCHSAYDLGGGRYMVTQTTEQRSPFGTNMGYSRLMTCDGPRPIEGWHSPFWGAEDYANCQPVSDWSPASSQGQGGQVAAGALIGVGIGAAGAVAGGSTSSATASQSVVVPAVRGHH